MEVIEDSGSANKVVYSKSVRWVNRKEFLCAYFSMISSFRITKYHVFKDSVENPGEMEVQELSDSLVAKKLTLLKKRVTCSTVRKVFQEEDLFTVHKSGNPVLCQVSFAQEGNRKAYLQKNVLDRYYRENTTLHDAYFGCPFSQKSHIEFLKWIDTQI